MENAVTVFSDKGNLPAYLADINEAGNIEIRERIPQLSFRGKVWRIVKDGVEEVVNRPGTDDPTSMVAGVLLDYNKARSRAYFEGAYEEGKTTAPTCWSHDGVIPHPTVVNKQSPTCASCDKAVKGSKVTDAGKEVTACSQFKRVAFVPIQNTKHVALLLKLPQTSIWDKDSEEWAAKGWYAFDQYVDMLKRGGINHTASVVTKIRFDPRTAYPKLLFGPMDYVPQDVVADIKEHLADKDGINKLLNVDPEGVQVATNGAAGTPTAAPVIAKAATPAETAPAPAAAPPEDEDDDAGAMMATVTGKPAPAAKAPPPKTATPVKGKVIPPKAATPVKNVEVVKDGDSKSSGIKDLLSSWSEEA